MTPSQKYRGSKGQNDLFDQKGKITFLTPGIFDWGHLRRYPAPRNPPPLRDKQHTSFLIEDPAQLGSTYQGSHQGRRHEVLFGGRIHRHPNHLPS